MATCPKCKGLMETSPNRARMICPNPTCPFDGWDVPEQVSLTQLLAEHKRFSDKLADIQNVIDGEGKLSHKLAEITSILEDE